MRHLLAALMVLAAASARAEGLVPRGFTLEYRTLADTNVTTQLVFDLEPSGFQVGVADSTFTIPDVVRAVWEGGPDDGLEWYFSDSHTIAVESDLLIHGFRRPGLGVVFFAPDLTAPPTETFPQIWVPAAPQGGFSWSWTGVGLCADYEQSRTEDYTATQGNIEVPYRESWTAFEITVAETISCGIEAADGRWFDALGRLAFPAKIAEPRWHTAISNGDGTWSILLKDGFVELVGVEFDGDPVVPTAQASFSDLKRRFRQR